MVEFAGFFEAATGQRPYRYQERLAAEGLPESLAVPTGCGKTAGAVLPWLWRVTTRPEVTPRRLVYVLPSRALVGQTVGKAESWVARLRAAGLVGEVAVCTVAGGLARDDDVWQLAPGRPTVIVGTIDMILSRLLMRGYVEQRALWPVSFGLLHAGSQFVFDETRLMGPAPATSARLEELRRKLGMVAGSASLWMSASPDPSASAPADHQEAGEPLGLDAADREALRTRLEARREIRRLVLDETARDYPAALARHLVRAHVPGTRTLAVLNTVDRAVAVHRALRRLVAEEQPDAPELLLTHGRFRREDRDRRLAALEAFAPGAPQVAGRGQIVVATQVVEAGLDISSRTLVTEAAPWSSVVQRAGRCNRAGEYPLASLWWVLPPASRAAFAPYRQADVEASAAALGEWEGAAVTTAALSRRRVAEQPAECPVVRRGTLLELFDTMPDPDGSDIDVGPYIRDARESPSVFVAWRAWPGGRPEDTDERSEPFPRAEELCPVAVSAVREVLEQGERGPRLWCRDRVDEQWRPVTAGDLCRPAAVFLADAASGGYDAEIGWNPASRGEVEPARQPESSWAPGGAKTVGRWVTLVEHLRDTEAEARAVAAELAPMTGLSHALVEAAALAGRYHDLGKAHEVFVATLGQAEGCPDPSQLWAKTPTWGGHHARPFFRHELAGALALLHPDFRLLAGHQERDLVAYLAAAHHGHTRLTVRAMPGENDDAPSGTRVIRQVRGVRSGDVLPAITVPDGPGREEVTPGVTLDLGVLGLEGHGPGMHGPGMDGPGMDDLAQQGLGPTSAGGPSWTERVENLLDRADLGPFRLAFLEAMVRVADWRASRAERGRPPREPVTWHVDGSTRPEAAPVRVS